VTLTGNLALESANWVATRRPFFYKASMNLNQSELLRRNAQFLVAIQGKVNDIVAVQYALPARRR